MVLGVVLFNAKVIPKVISPSPQIVEDGIVGV